MSLHVLSIPSWYPNEYNQLSGIFFKEQNEELSKSEKIRLNVIVVQPIGIKPILKTKKIKFGFYSYLENNIYTYMFQYPYILRNFDLDQRIKIKVFQKIFKKYVEKHGIPDIVHLHSFGAGELALYLKNNYNIPYTVTEHSTVLATKAIRHKLENFCKKVYSNSSFNIAVSRKYANLLEEKFQIKFEFIPNFVNSEFFKFFPKKDKNEFVFINVAFLNKRKGQDMLVKAFYRAFKDIHSVKLIIAGDGPEYNNLRNLIKSLNMENRIILFGKVDRNQVMKLMSSSDAFVLSSYYETFGVVLAEALAVGLPVVSTKCGGPESIITNNKVGILTDISELDLAEGMYNLYINRDKFDTNYIKTFAYDNFSSNTVVKKYLDIYYKISGSKNENPIFMD
jgi:glycosyltransferase involved in cell wall biosynthesis